MERGRAVDLAPALGYGKVPIRRRCTIPGNRPTLEELFDSHAGELLGYASAILRRRDLAEDALQETFVRAARRWAKLPRDANVRGYLFRIMRNEALRLAKRERRRAQREREYGERQLFEAGCAANANPERTERTERAEAALRELPDEQREVVYLKCVQGLTFRQIAGLLAASQNTVASRYRYGLEKMRIMLEGEPAADRSPDAPARGKT